jgi:hypothetical protein
MKVSMPALCRFLQRSMGKRMIWARKATSSTICGR